MLKRTVTSLLWLFAVWTGGGMLSVFAGAPSLLGPALGIAVAGLVWWDPAGWLWPRQRSVSPAMRRRLADLERVSASTPRGEVRREPESTAG